MTNLDTKALEAALLPCPFCGGPVELRRSSIPRRVAFQIRCPACCFDVTRDGSDLDEHATRSAIIKGWNRRASPPSILEEAATLADAANEKNPDAGFKELAAAIRSLREGVNG